MGYFVRNKHLESNGRFDERFTFEIFMDMFNFQCKPGQRCSCSSFHKS